MPQIASLPWPCWKMKTTIPNAMPSEIRFITTAFIASTTERNARISRMNVRMITNASTYGKLP